MAEVFRAAFDQPYEDQRTGRYRVDQLFNTEETHFRTLIEVNLLSWIGPTAPSRARDRRECAGDKQSSSALRGQANILRRLRDNWQDQVMENQEISRQDDSGELDLPTFETAIFGEIEALGLPSGDILVPVRQRAGVRNQMSDVLEPVDAAAPSKSAYLSEVHGGRGTRTFDAAFNYFGDETTATKTKHPLSEARRMKPTTRLIA